MQTETPTPDRQPERGQRRPLLLGAMLLVLALGGVAVALTLGGDSTEGNASGPPQGAPNAVSGAEGQPPAAPDAAAASCVTSYSLTTLTQREHAFAATVTAIEGDDITFDVEEVFRGEATGTVTLGGGALLAGTTPDSGPPLEVGDRVLVAGDGRFAWGCGFTQPYDEEVATDWRAALGG